MTRNSSEMFCSALCAEYSVVGTVRYERVASQWCCLHKTKTNQPVSPTPCVPSVSATGGATALEQHTAEQVDFVLSHVIDGYAQQAVSCDQFTGRQNQLDPATQ
jgi:hypothetical protein